MAQFNMRNDCMISWKNTTHVNQDTLIRIAKTYPAGGVNLNIPVHEFAKRKQHRASYVVAEPITAIIATKKTWINIIGTFDPVGGDPSV